MSLTNIFFDFDGVLLDSIEAHEQAFRQAFDNFEIQHKNFYYITGRSSKSLVQEFLHGNNIFDVKLIKTIVEEKQKIVRARIEETLPIFENEIEVLTSLRKKFKLTIVSSSTNYLIKKFLLKYNLENVFSRVISNENTSNSKPNPEPYLLALNINKVESINSIAIEDSEMGINSAIEAGLKVIKFNPTCQKDYSDSKIEKIECVTYNEIYEAISECSSK